MAEVLFKHDGAEYRKYDFVLCRAEKQLPYIGEVLRKCTVSVAVTARTCSPYTALAGLLRERGVEEGTVIIQWMYRSFFRVSPFCEITMI